MAHLEELLRGRAPAAAPDVVVTDSVFSMDGDVGPDRRARSPCARRHGALLVLDEAHAVLGPDLPPAPIARGSRTADAWCRVGTLSKTLGSLGGFVAASRDVVDLLVNRARPYIFSTAPTPGRCRGRAGRARASCVPPKARR